MTRRSYIRTTRDRRSEAYRMPDLLLLKHFVITHESRKDRKSSRISRGPTCRSQRIRIQIEDRT